MKKFILTAMIGFSPIPGVAAFAQDWTASCGNEPKSPVINVSNVTKYNASVEQFNNYNKAVHVYYGCISKQAHAKQVAISQKAKNEMESIQKVSAEMNARITANLTKMRATIVDGSKKLKNATGGK
ncbi:hypothetical protein H3T50_01520 [Commensalibacter sp. M0134]|uniref:hypothetical protein n=1 Tax=Commensalibacter TaxID=1079922 RepID=UPI0018DC53A6|nr:MULTISPECIES: hypothetical protein [Commensalibacter]MBI0065348.1 hypothetical protein [Commensalibacter sp. M0134]MBI0069231.1 hypothetical protein [Commensalibacter sp. M0133]MBI0081166.1 hypothetical protein [Commensalibacter melissae]MBI0082878.1 hypothetical protein [Commensalibacter sp. W6292M3]MBI0088305.1 hypothetical protein [Commensalibacter melissae]